MDIDTLRADILRELTLRYGPLRAAGLDIASSRGEGHHTINLDPAAVGQASVSIRIEWGEIYIGFGRGLQVDLLLKSCTHIEAVEDVLEIVAAVAEGRLTETTWEVSEDVVKAKGVLDLPSGRLRLRYERAFHTRMFRPAKKRRYDYRPWRST